MPEIQEFDQNEDLIVGEDSSSEEFDAGLSKWFSHNEAKFQFPSLNNARKSQLGKLIAKRISSDSRCRLKSIEFLRILSRDKNGIESLVNEELISSLATCAQLSSIAVLDDGFTDTPTLLEAIKTLCNLVFNSDLGRSLLGNETYLVALINRIAKHSSLKISPSVQLFDLRLAFLLSALCPDLRTKLRNHCDGLAALESVLQGYSASYPHGLDDQSVDVIIESLKVLFNLTMSFRNTTLNEKEKGQVISLVEQLRRLLVARINSNSKREQLLSNVVNQLTTFPSEFYPRLFSHEVEGQSQVDFSSVRAIVDLLEMRLDTKSADSSDLTPVLLVLSDMTRSDRRVRKYLRQLILPPLRDVTNRPEEGDTLRNRLVRLMTSVSDLSHVSADLLYALCKENVDRLIKYTGFGNAAGLLSTFGLLGGGQKTINESEDSEDSDTQEYVQAKPNINPVVGCVEPPKPDPTADWSEERKEYEANKLVKLIDDMIKLGAVTPGQVGPDGRVRPVEHVLQLQEGMKLQSSEIESDSD